MASLQPDQAAFVLTALANDPARLHQPAPGLATASTTQNGSSLEDLAGTDMSGVAGAIMVFEQVVRVRAHLNSLHAPEEISMHLKTYLSTAASTTNDVTHP